jgi:CzcA family heavy metal efflux pump
MGWLIGSALRIRFIVVAAAIVLLTVGGNIVRNTSIDVFPEFAPPRVEIQTEVPGLSADQVEALVTVPLESALNGAPWLTTVRSKSVLGLSSITLFFQDGVDVMQARQVVQERVAIAASELTAVASPPVILSPLSSTSRVLKIGMQSETLNQTELTTLALWTIRPRLMAIPGVANAAVWGQRERQLQVQVDPQRLLAHGVTLDEVLASAAAAVSAAGGAFIDGPNQRLSVTHLPAVRTAEDLSSIVVTHRDGLSLTLGQVADIAEGSPPPIGDAIINDEPGILLIIEKQPWGNTLEVTRSIEAVLEDLAPALQGVDVDPTIFRPATYIENAVANLNTALLLGVVLVIAVLSVFLYDWRAALISVLAIPLSLLTAALVMNYTGGTIDTMVLAGLIIALGEVVDDAIIDVENIMRRLRLNRAAGSPESPFSVVLKASLEVRSAVVFGSLIVALVLVPVFTLDGLSGAFFHPLALAYIVAILASLAVALTLTPALGLLLLPRAAERRSQDSPLVLWLKARYRPLLERLVHRPRRCLAAVAGAALVALAIYPLLGQELLPSFREYDFLMHWLERPGTSLDAMNRVTIRASRELRGVDGVRNFGAHVGRAEVADEVVGIDFTELWISLDPSVPYDATVGKIQGIVDGYPGLFRDLLTYLRERIKEVLTGTSGAVVVRIYGPDLTHLERMADEVAERLAGIEGVDDLHVQHQTLIPQIAIKFDAEAAAIVGLTPGDLRRVTEVMLTGVKVGEIYDEQKVFDLVVRGTPQVAANMDALRDMLIDIRGGGAVPLRDVADVYIAPTPNQVTREAGSRRIDVTLNPSGRSLSAVAADVEAALAEVSFDQGYYPEVLGEYAELAQGRQRLVIAGAISAVAILLLLHAVFDSVRIGLLIFLSLPGALIGGVAGALLGGGVLSLGSWIGFITVLGIAARNGIMLISHYRHLESEEGMPFGPSLVLRGAEERLAPILMTTLTTWLALLPLVLGGVRPGQEVEHPMAVVILGGLVTSALLNLFVVPALYLRYAKPPVSTSALR